MSHHIYTTEGFVLSATPFGEANLFVCVLTRDLGLVSATVRSVRELKSKLRYGLQEFCLSSVSLVRGRHEWKITSAVPEFNLWHACAERPDAFRICAQAFSLVRKLVVGEEKNEALFEIIRDGLHFLETETRSHDFSSEQLRSFECILMLRIVHNLGYLKPDPALMAFITEQTWSADLLATLAPIQKKAIQAINDAIRESQL
jgi:DNA repair protein RecO